MRLAIALFAGAVLLGVLAWCWHRGSGASPVVASTPSTGPGFAPGSAMNSPPGPSPLAMPVVHGSTRDASARREAQRNQVFRIDAGGDLILDAAVAQRLQALVDGLPARHSLAELEHVEGLVGEGLPEPQASQARRLLHGYLAYSKEQAWLVSQPRQAEDLASAQEMLERVIALRREYLGAQVAGALFGDEEAQTRAAMAALRAQLHAQGATAAMRP